MVQLVRGAQHGHAVSGDKCVVASWTLGHGRAVRRHDGDRGQVSEVSSEGVVCVVGRLHLELHHGEIDPVELNIVGPPSQAGLDEGGAGERGHVEPLPGPEAAPQGAGHRRVGQLDHECHLGPQLAHAQSRLERVDLVHLDADHRRRPVEVRFDEALTAIGVSTDVLDSPVLERPGEARIRIVVDHQDARPAQMEYSTVRRPHPEGRTRSRVRCRGPLPLRHVANRIRGRRLPLR